MFVLLSGDVRGAGVSKPGLEQPGSPVCDAEVDLFGGGEAGDAFPDERPRPVLVTSTEQRGGAATEGRHDVVLGIAGRDHLADGWVVSDILEHAEPARNEDDVVFAGVEILQPCRRLEPCTAVYAGYAPVPGVLGASENPV